MEVEAIRSALEERGPLGGKELYLACGGEVFDLWRASHLEFMVERVGRRYLRFDKNVEGYARLSPAIEREFLTYSVIGTEGQGEALRERAMALGEEIKRISERKMRLAERTVREVAEPYDLGGMCFIIGGDVPLGMAHSDPRPERSTGKLVAGSDLDIVVVARDDFPEKELGELDDAIHGSKYTLLRDQLRREELDYLVKRFSRVREQVRFDSFESMVACKILNEGRLLHGSRELHHDILLLLRDNSIPSKLRGLEGEALKNREAAEEFLLQKGEIGEEEYMKLFTTTEEFGEIF